MKRPIFKSKRQPAGFFNGKPLYQEKIIGLAWIDKKDALMADFIGLQVFLTKGMWDNFKDVILRVKGLPLKEAEIKFNYFLCEDFEEDVYMFRVVIEALRDRGRGRRSAAFSQQQIKSLSEFEPIYTQNTTKAIGQSGILQAMMTNDKP